MCFFSNIYRPSIKTLLSTFLYLHEALMSPQVLPTESASIPETMISFAVATGLISSLTPSTGLTVGLWSLPANLMISRLFLLTLTVIGKNLNPYFMTLTNPLVTPVIMFSKCFLVLLIQALSFLLANQTLIPTSQSLFYSLYFGISWTLNFLNDFLSSPKAPLHVTILFLISIVTFSGMRRLSIFIISLTMVYNFFIFSYFKML